MCCIIVVYCFVFCCTSDVKYKYETPFTTFGHRKEPQLKYSTPRPSPYCSALPASLSLSLSLMISNPFEELNAEDMHPATALHRWMIIESRPSSYHPFCFLGEQATTSHRHALSCKAAWSLSTALSCPLSFVPSSDLI